MKVIQEILRLILLQKVKVQVVFIQTLILIDQYQLPIVMFLRHIK